MMWIIVLSIIAAIPVQLILYYMSDKQKDESFVIHMGRFIFIFFINYILLSIFTYVFLQTAPLISEEMRETLDEQALIEKEQAFIRQEQEKQYMNLLCGDTAIRLQKNIKMFSKDTVTCYYGYGKIEIKELE